MSADLFDPATRGSSWTACDTCGARWTGKSECHCSSCHRNLGGLGLFERHIKHGRCLSDRALRERGMRKQYREPRCPVWRLGGAVLVPLPQDEEDGDE